ncbi:MAG: hypothetical protein ACTHU0_25595 [Kofleriaceae bacterium]
MREPTHGGVLAGEPSVIAIHVAGDYDVAGAQLSVQVLADPDDLASWTTIATTTSENAGGASARFGITVRPVANVQEAPRWPRGGVLRLRVVDPDGNALPYDPSDPDDAVLAVVNPAEIPETWSYLLEKPVCSRDETAAYYAAIDAPPTLDAFQTRYGFPRDEIVARYYNAGDLGIGREMHCRATAAPAGGVACYVRNFGTFGGARGQAISELIAGGVPLATVAMVYAPPIDAPNAVSFVVYGPDGALVTEAQLDTRGDNASIPQNCLNCHGGRSTYDPATHAARGARFLAFDPAAFDFAPEANFASQDESFRRLNQLVAATEPTSATRELIDGIYAAGAPYDPGFVPPGWADTSSDRRVYREVIAPYCRGCHVSFGGTGATGGDPVAFASAADLRDRAASTLVRVCGTGPRGMPTAEQTARHFFGSSARAVLLPWLGVPGACAP